ncbi:MAG: AraC family transcriptional regulator [Oscillospiraceae bacterium]|nr:AraC family transcriptional regulator [Oscillospiraceae bacterium]
MLPSVKLLEDFVRKPKAFPVYIYNFSSVYSHWHEELEIVYAETGGSIEINGEAVGFGEQDIIFVNTGHLHSITAARDGKLWAVLFRFELLEFKYDDLCQTRIIDPLKYKKLLFPRILRKGEPLHEDIRRQVAEILRLEHVPRAELQIKNGLYEIIALLHQHRAFIPADNLPDPAVIGHVKKAIVYMEQHFTDPVTIDLLAEHTNLNKFYLIDIFKRITGLTPIIYLRNIRAGHAARLLKEGATVTYAALASGFNSPGYFNTVFKKVYGVSPGRYNFM